MAAVFRIVHTLAKAVLGALPAFHESGRLLC